MILESEGRLDPWGSIPQMRSGDMRKPHTQDMANFENSGGIEQSKDQGYE